MKTTIFLMLLVLSPACVSTSFVNLRYPSYGEAFPGIPLPNAESWPFQGIDSPAVFVRKKTGYYDRVYQEFMWKHMDPDEVLTTMVIFYRDGKCTIRSQFPVEEVERFASIVNGTFRAYWFFDEAEATISTRFFLEKQFRENYLIMEGDSSGGSCLTGISPIDGQSPTNILIKDKDGKGDFSTYCYSLDLSRIAPMLPSEGWDKFSKPRAAYDSYEYR